MVNFIFTIDKGSVVDDLGEEADAESIEHTDSRIESLLLYSITTPFSSSGQL